MIGGFDSEIYFVTDNNKIVKPVTNYFTEKFFEGEINGRRL